MATWATHLIIADQLSARLNADRRGFCVGNIAPDCNIENADWSAFTPPREVTHFMSGKKKSYSDCEAFREKYLRKPENTERFAFFLGYYTHLLTDVAFQDMLRDEKRVKSVWTRIMDSDLANEAAELPRTFDSIKILLPKQTREREFEYLESLYLNENPDSGYLTEILPLKEFPDYTDFLPPGAIVRKVRMMTIPRREPVKLIFISKPEFDTFILDTVMMIAEKLETLAPLQV